MLASAALFAVFLLAGAVGGGGFAPDAAVLRNAAGWRQSWPRLASVEVGVTQLGSAVVTLTAAAVAAAWLTAVGRIRSAMAIAVTVIGGRMAVEGLKLLADRPRPAADGWAVSIHSLSFPSAHSANAMITWLALALIALPQRWRRPGLVAALAVAFAVGLTRPLLGVHWPTDVIGGWSFGAAWVLAAMIATDRSRAAASLEQQH